LFDVVVPLWAEVDAETIHAGQFGLIQQFGAGVENIDIAAATSAGPKVIATAHNAALTTSYFRRAAGALGEALAAQVDGRRPPNALNAPIQARTNLAR
jgi:phosphoglycerate dehydrogenase-like enzyme